MKIPERNSESHFGTYGWMAIGAFVAVFDCLAPETMSDAVDRALTRPAGRVAVAGAIAVTSAHLLNVLPKAIDPYAFIGDQLNKLRG